MACLVDWYIERDLAPYCKNPPNTPKQQADYLTRRGIIDELTSHVLERAIGNRNRVEHDYHIPTIAEAEDIVELLRRTIAMLRAPNLILLLHPCCVELCWARRVGTSKDRMLSFTGGPTAVVFCRFNERP